MPLKKATHSGINLNQHLYNLGCIVSRKILSLKPFPMTPPSVYKASRCLVPATLDILLVGQKIVSQVTLARARPTMIITSFL